MFPGWGSVSRVGRRTPVVACTAVGRCTDASSRRRNRGPTQRRLACVCIGDAVATAYRRRDRRAHGRKGLTRSRRACCEAVAHGAVLAVEARAAGELGRSTARRCARDGARGRNAGLGRQAAVVVRLAVATADGRQHSGARRRSGLAKAHGDRCDADARGHGAELGRAAVGRLTAGRLATRIDPHRDRQRR